MSHGPRRTQIGGWCPHWATPECVGPSFTATYHVGGGEPTLCDVCERKRLAAIAAADEWIARLVECEKLLPRA